jgi:hypothetical protein
MIDDESHILIDSAKPLKHKYVDSKNQKILYGSGGN